ncbi:MAG: response regulator [Wenzhouxiangellaceae bacterium]|nr:response regulator [Wenzhouxiangellaceae bacterium]
MAGGRRKRGGNAASILVVDDHALNRDLMRGWLRGIVRVVHEAADADGAHRAALRHRPDLVLLDLHMPGRDGFAAWRAIRDGLGDRAPRAIAVTADARPEVRDRARAAGFSGWLPKPVTSDALRVCLREVLAGRHAFSSGPERDSGDERLLDDDAARAAAGSDANAARMRHALATEIGAQRADLERMLAADQREAAREMLHRWRGGCAYAGAVRLERHCERLDRLLGDAGTAGNGEPPQENAGGETLGDALFALLRTAAATCVALGLAQPGPLRPGRPAPRGIPRRPDPGP